MPDDPLTQGAAPRFDSIVAVGRYAALLGCFAAGMWGSSMLDRFRPRPAIITPKPERLQSLRRVAAVTAGVTVVLVIFQNRHIVLSPNLIAESLQRGLSYYASSVREQESGGLATAVNLFSVPVAIWSALYFHPLSSAIVRRSSLQGLVFLGAVLVVAAFLNTARMWLVQFVMIVVGSYAFYRRTNWSGVCVAVVMTACCAWAAELTRWGVWYQNTSGTMMFSYEMQQMIGRRLVEGYIAADLNNAFILLDDEPSMKLVSSAVSIRRFLCACGLLEDDWQGAAYEDISNWTSIFGAVNVVGLLWYDLGWFAGVILALLGAFLARCFAYAEHTRMEVGNGLLVYLVCFPGLFAMTRINYFALSVFVMPFLGLIGFAVYDTLLNRPALATPISRTRTDS